MKHPILAAWLSTGALLSASCAEPVRLTLESKNQPGRESAWSWYWGSGSSAKIEAAGRHSRLSYSFGCNAANFTLRSGIDIPPGTESICLRIKGDGKGHALFARIIDRTGQTFLYPLERNLDWTDWRTLEFPIGGWADKWSGNGDAVIDLPATLALQMNASAPGDGELLLDGIRATIRLSDANRTSVRCPANLFGSIAYGTQDPIRITLEAKDLGNRGGPVEAHFSVFGQNGTQLTNEVRQLELPGEKPLLHQWELPFPFGFYTVQIVLRRNGLEIYRTTTTAARVPEQPPRPATEPNPFGMNLSLTTRHTAESRLPGATAAAAAGIGWTREEFSWDRIEPSPGVFQWDETDAAVSVAEQHGLKVLGLIAYSARWARIDPNQTTSPPRDPEQYARFVAAVVSRYKGRVSHWELWNEPDSPVFWPPKPNAAAYATLLSAAYRAAKTADPSSTILNAGLLIGMNHRGYWDYLDQWAQAGGSRSVDAFAWHAYCDPQSPEQGGYPSIQRELRRRLDAAGLGKTSLWLTEQGWATIANYNKSVSFEDQAAYVVRAHVLALSEPNVATFFWFLFRDGGNRESDPEQSFGILHPDGSPKPAFCMYVVMTSLLRGARPVPERNVETPFYRRSFRRDGEQIDVVWSLEPTLLPKSEWQGKRAMDAYGRTLPQFDGTLSAQPVYLISGT